LITLDFFFCSVAESYNFYAAPADLTLGCPRNKQIILLVQTKTNRNLTCFGSIVVCFTKPIKYFFSLFRFLSVFWIHNETTEINRFVLKPELGIRYFLPFSLFANPLLQCSYSLSLLCYFNVAIRYRYSATFQKFAIRYSLLPLNSVIGFI
jgi:hypothetical protein